MFHLVFLRIMKKLLYSALALAGIFAVACNKEVEAPVAPEQKEVKTSTYTIQATIGDETRTAYENFQKFSWKADDKISVFTYSETEETTRIASFTAAEDGVTTTFSGEVEDGYLPVSLATYPDNAGFIQGEPGIYLPSAIFMDGDSEKYYTADSDNPLANLALVGTLNEDGTTYAFKTAMGAVKVSLSNLPAEARFLRIYAPEKISGYFHIDENYLLTNESAVPGTYTYTNTDGEEVTTNYSNRNLWYHFTPASDGTVTLYIPLPVGKLSAGTTFFIENEDEEVLYQRNTAKDIVIERNKITELTTLSTQSVWKSLGTGKFIDNFNWATAGFDAGTYVDVEIEVDESNPSHYRLVRPYNAAFTQFGYKPRMGTASPTEYFDLYIQPDGHVDYPIICTGIYYKSYREATLLLSPTTAYTTPKTLGLNLVAKYQSDGKTPANILLAPSYYWQRSGYWTGDSYFNSAEEIQIIFPGETEAVNLTCSAAFTEIVDDSTEQPIALIDVTFGSSLSGANVILAQSLEEAQAAVAAGNFGGTATESGDTEVLLPADAPSADYYIYLNPVPAEGISPLVSSLLFESESPFQYIRSDVADVEVQDIVGTYLAKDTYVFFNKPYWDAVNAGEEDPQEDEADETWYGGYNVSFTLEESDDEGLGDVMMTAFTEDAVGYCDIETPIYAFLDRKSGAITFPPMQSIYSFDNEGEEIQVMLANADNFKLNSLVFELSLDRTTYTSKQFFGYVLYWTDHDGFSYDNIWFSPTNVPMKLVKQTDEASAPAKVRAARTEPAVKKAPVKRTPRDVTRFQERPLLNAR